MKKTKIGATLILISLFLAIVCVGVYVAMPSNNTVMGSVTLNPKIQSIDVDFYINNELISSHKQVESAITFTKGLNNLTFKTHWTDEDGNPVQADEPEEVENIQLRFHIKNNSDKAIGVYFSKSLQSSNALTADTISATLSTGKNVNFAGVELSDYTTMQAHSLQNDTDECQVTITFKCTSLVEEDIKNIMFNYYMNIEEYTE